MEPLSLPFLANRETSEYSWLREASIHGQQSETLYFAFSICEDENYQAIDGTGNRAVAPDGKGLFIRTSHFEEKVLQHLNGKGSSKLPAQQNWMSNVVNVHAGYQLLLDIIVNAPLSDGGASSGREG